MDKMQYVSKKSATSSLKEAILQGFAPDGGLYLPSPIPRLKNEEIKKMASWSFQEISLHLASLFLKQEVPKRELEEIIHRAFSFPLPLIPFDEGRFFGLELFHGPTLSFKDIGARFMAELVSHFLKPGEKLLVLVATTGDTGSAVGEAFFRREGVTVCILYPKGRVTAEQEKQLTTIGGNVLALEIEGSFDDCQRLLKQAVEDKDLKEKRFVTTGNSINIARLLPQSFYYFYGTLQLPLFMVAVPSGNFGHLASGLLAKRMGAPIDKFIAVTNINDEVPIYLKTGIFSPHPSWPTLASSMDVGNPSNFSRLCDLCDNNWEKMHEEIIGISITDREIEEGIRELYLHQNHILDPHSFTGYLAMKRQAPPSGLFLETAHPAKFASIVEKAIGKKIARPPSLQEKLSRPKKAILLPPTYSSLKSLLSTL